MSIIEERIKEFQDFLDKEGLKSFIFVNSDIIRGHHSNFDISNENDFLLLRDSVDAMWSAVVERHKWSAAIAQRSPFRVICVRNYTMEKYLKRGEAYAVISVFDRVDGFDFIICDKTGKIMESDRERNFFHSSLFMLDNTYLLQNN